MSEQVKKWYVVRAISGKEGKVKEYLEHEIDRLNLQDYISQVLIPKEKVYQVRKGKKISKERNYFPGYVLIEAALSGEIPHIIRNIPNVLGFLGTKGEPDPIRPAEVNRILGKRRDPAFLLIKADLLIRKNPRSKKARELLEEAGKSSSVLLSRKQIAAQIKLLKRSLF